jgi:hypothetical protein
MAIWARVEQLCFELGCFTIQVRAGLCHPPISLAFVPRSGSVVSGEELCQGLAEDITFMGSRQHALFATGPGRALTSLRAVSGTGRGYYNHGQQAACLVLQLDLAVP